MRGGVMKLDNLTEGERFIVEWQYRMIGGFKTALIGAIKVADRGNQAKLAAGFPAEVQAYLDFTQIDGWWEKVQIKAGIEEG